MDDKTQAEESGGSASDAIAAYNVFRQARNEMNALLDEVLAGNSARAKKLGPIVGELAKAVGRMADEGNRLNGDRKRQSDTIPGDPLDLEFARHEIGRRLARLRAAG